jgi:hypothetical protein
MTSSNTRGAFLGLVWLVLGFLKMELLMHYNKTKTLELGIQDLEEKKIIRWVLLERWIENILHGTKYKLVSFE